MKSQIIAAVQNLFGTFIHHLHGGDSADLAAMFCDNGTLEFPIEKAVCRGRREIRDRLSLRQSRVEYILLQSPAFMVFDNMHHAKGMWEANTITTDPRSSSFEHGSCRFDADFSLTDEGWRISRLVWYDMMSFLPIPCPAERLADADLRPDTLPPLSSRIPAGDGVALQNLMGLYCHTNRRGISSLWVTGEDVVLDLPTLLPAPCRGFSAVQDAFILLERRERDNGGYFLSIPFLSAPVLNGNGDEAEGWWLAQSFCLTAPGEDGDARLRREISRCHARFLRQDGRWLFRELHFHPCFALPDERLDHNMPGQISITPDDNHWTYPVRTDSFAHLYPYDVYRIQSVLPQWTSRLRRGLTHEFLDDYYMEDKDNIVLHIRINPQVGRAEVATRMEEYDTRYVHRQPTSHNGSTPYCWINETGDEALVHWLDQSWTNKNGVFFRDDFPIPFFRTSGNYCFYFVKEHGEWKVSKIQWMPICLLEDLYLDPARSRGWAGTVSSNPWPLPFEDLVL